MSQAFLETHWGFLFSQACSLENNISSFSRPLRIVSQPFRIEISHFRNISAFSTSYFTETAFSSETHITSLATSFRQIIEGADFLLFSFWRPSSFRLTLFSARASSSFSGFYCHWLLYSFSLCGSLIMPFSLRAFEYYFISSFSFLRGHWIRRWVSD